MSSLKSWTGSMVMLLALAQAAHADMMVSQSNDPAAPVSINLVGLFTQENTALESVDAGRFSEIITPPVETKTVKASKSAKAAAPSGPATYDATWIRAIPDAEQTAALDCLARAIYFEARGESIKGQAAVAEVVLNRTQSPVFPRTVCGVVQQAGNGGCQFSFVCDGRADTIADRNAWYVAEKVASAYIAGAPRTLTDGATYFHTPAVWPSWAKRFPMTARIGSHYFYRQPIQTAMN
jgi:spore germination cell wall hydrolase CwlJ-like protein